MNSLNEVKIIGNLTNDPELKQTPTGKSVATFSIATNKIRKDEAGVKKEQVQFHNIVVWGKLAEICDTYLTKGKKVYVSGELQTKTWEDNSGVKKWKTEIKIDNMMMLGVKGEGEGKVSNPAEDVPKKKTTAKDDDEINIEDIPF